jgi:hypothetical protein|tara:strand:- start:7420 stop:7896 length:477 start_codon:yes stop_codon:yes gene_type:complete
MATSEFSVALSEVQKYQPDIAEFGITNFDTQLQFGEDDVIRQIREEWWERYRHTVRYKDITKVTTLELDSSKLTNAQWLRCVVYKSLSEYIYPMLTKWKDPQGGDGQDAFQIQIDFYRKKYAEEFQAVLRDGVEYDEDSSGTIQASEKEPIHNLRLVR